MVGEYERFKLKFGGWSFKTTTPSISSKYYCRVFWGCDCNGRGLL